MNGAARRPLRVMTLLDHLDRGGAERIALAIAVGLDRTRFSPALCLSRQPESETRERLAALGLPAIWLERGNRLMVWRWLRLLRVLRRERVDVLHAHLFGSNLWAALIGRAAGTPVIIATEHTWSFEGRPLRRFLDGHVIGRLVTAFVAVSEEDRRRMAEIEGVPEDRLHVIGTGLLPRKARDAAADRREIRAELNAGDRVVIGTVGRLVPQKRVDVLIGAVRRLVDEGHPVVLWVVGSGEDREALEASTCSAGIASHVRFLGERDDVQRILPALDVFVLSSDYEGRPLALLEAWAAGLASVVTAVGDVPRMVGESGCAELVPAGDPAALAAALAAVATDPCRRDDLGRRAARRVEEEFDLGRIIGRWEALYTDLRAVRAGSRRS